MATTNRRDVIGQHILIGISGTSLTQEEKQFIVKNNISGVTLFARNLQSTESLHDLTTELQSLRHQMVDRTPLLIAIDMEGGRVARLKKPFTEWPPLQKLGTTDSATLCFKFSESMGKELVAFGINMDYAPCADLLTNPKNTVIGDRSLGQDPEKVGKLASALVRGYIKSNIIPCAKHFPGHGNTLLDSHDDLPVENIDAETLKNRELVPFKRSFRARLDFLMTAHIKYSNVDPEFPATFSSIILKDILRNELRYKNFVITDDLDMKALTKNYSREEIPVLALKAGNDFLLYCNEPSSPPLALEAIEKALQDGKLSQQELEARHRRIVEYKSRKLHSPDPFPLDKAMDVINSTEHKDLSAMVARGESMGNEALDE